MFISIDLQAPHVTQFARRLSIDVEKGSLHSTLGMSTENTELTNHLESSLKRID
jgi:hypothetical protein